MLVVLLVVLVVPVALVVFGGDCGSLLLVVLWVPVALVVLVVSVV